jgi:DNA invertase Pin-like site-specific DNA recombinase
MDATTPHGKAMLQMAAVFAELERGMIRERVMAGLERARAQGVDTRPPQGGPEVENAIRGLIRQSDHSENRSPANLVLGSGSC